MLDFSLADRRDYRWQLHEELVLGSLEDEAVTKMNELAHQWHCAAAQITGWDDEEAMFEHHRKMALKSYNTIGKSLLPWYDDWVKIEEKSLSQQWKEFKDREKDPAYNALLKAERQRLRDLVKDVEEQEKFSVELQKTIEQDKIRKAAMDLDRKRRKENAKFNQRHAR